MVGADNCQQSRRPSAERRAVGLQGAGRLDPRSQRVAPRRLRTFSIPTVQNGWWMAVGDL